MPLYKEELDRVMSGGCQAEGCTEDHGEMYVHAQCHMRSGMEVKYLVGSGILSIGCGTCHKPIVSVHIANSLQREVKPV